MSNGMFNLNLSDTNKEINVQNKDVSKRVNVRKVNITELHESKDNFYSIRGVPELAEEIRVNGLLNPIKVTRDMEVLSGHRRLAAHKLLAETEDEFKEVEVIFVEDFETSEEKQLFLITENSARVKTKDDIATEMTQKKELYTKLKEQGSGEYKKANITKLIANEYGVSEATVKRATKGTSKNKPKSPEEEFRKKFNSLCKYMEQNSKDISVPDHVYNVIVDYYMEMNQIELDLKMNDDLEFEDEE